MKNWKISSTNKSGGRYLLRLRPKIWKSVFLALNKGGGYLVVGGYLPRLERYPKFPTSSLKIWPTKPGLKKGVALKKYGVTGITGYGFKGFKWFKEEETLRSARENTKCLLKSLSSCNYAPIIHEQVCTGFLEVASLVLNTIFTGPFFSYG